MACLAKWEDHKSKSKIQLDARPLLYTVPYDTIHIIIKVNIRAVMRPHTPVTPPKPHASASRKRAVSKLSFFWRAHINATKGAEEHRDPFQEPLTTSARHSALANLAGPNCLRPTPAYTTLATPTRHRRNRFQVPYPTTSLPAARAWLCTQWRAPGTAPGPAHLNVPRGAPALDDQPQYYLVGPLFLREFGARDDRRHVSLDTRSLRPMQARKIRSEDDKGQGKTRDGFDDGTNVGPAWTPIKATLETHEVRPRITRLSSRRSIAADAVPSLLTSSPGSSGSVTPDWAVRMIVSERVDVQMYVKVEVRYKRVKRGRPAAGLMRGMF
ncbi:hypothetical protein V8E53_005839 [Lactarius tabidus]